MSHDTIEMLALLADKYAQQGYLQYLDHVIVDAQPVKGRWKQLAEPWQWEREERIAPALDCLGGLNDGYKGPLSFWNGYSKGHDKTHAAARRICWLLGWSKRRVNCYVCGGDKDQAALVTLAMRGVVQDNPWIASKVKVTKHGAEGVSGSTLTVMPLEAFTGQGIFPDYLDAEEVTHWQHDAGKAFWDFILESVNKRPLCVMEVNTNAGYQATWQWEERNRISRSKFWSFYEQPYAQRLATWMNEEKIADDSQGIEPTEVERLYRNKWVDPGEVRGYLTLAEAEACVDHARVEAQSGEGQQYFVIVDYGGSAVDVNKADRCALTVGHVEDVYKIHYGKDLKAVFVDPRFVVDRMDCWMRSLGERVLIDIPDNDKNARCVEGWLELTCQTFQSIAAIVLDPYQLEGLAQKMEKRGRRVIRFEYRAGKNNYRMAQVMKLAVQNRRVCWSPGAGLLPELSPTGKRLEDRTLAQELSKLITVPTSYGYRFDHESGRHDDRAWTLAAGILHAMPEMPPGGWSGADVKVVTAPVVEHQRQSAFPSIVPQIDQAQAWNIFGMRSVLEEGGRK